MKNFSKHLKKSFFLIFASLCLFPASTEEQKLPEWIGGIRVPETEYANQAISKYINQYTTTFGKQQLFEVLDGGELYRLYVRQELKKRGMPPVLEYLPVVESDYNPLAVSRSGAKGLWQFMDNSIAGLLKKTEWIDERYDPWKSTDAALTKLQDNYKQFKDWPLALAAYNCGAGAMKKILKQAKVKTFWYISETGLLRDQSVQYVPKLLAICLLSTYPSHFQLEMPEISVSTRFAEFDYITTKEQIYLERLSSELKMDYQILERLNPALLKKCTPPSGIYNLRLPAGMKASAQIAIDDITGKAPVNSKTKAVLHTVQQGETLWSISKKYGVSVNSIREQNGLTQNQVLTIGKTLYIK